LGTAVTPDVDGALVYSQRADWAAKTTFKGVMLSRDPTSNQNFYGKALNSREAHRAGERPRTRRRLARGAQDARALIVRDSSSARLSAERQTLA
jgi:hypothetical protein